MRIGPHIFSNTSFYEVHYLPQAANLAPSHSQSTIPKQNNPHTVSSSSSATNPSQSPISTAQLAVSASTGHTHLQNASPPPISSAVVTPDMVSQVNVAAESNPTLKNLLRLVASSRATPEQLKTLGLLIQSLGPPQQPSMTAAQTTVPGSSYTVKDFDIVIEFQEKPSDRWIIPRGPAVCEWARSDVNGLPTSDINLSLAVPFPQAQQLHIEKVTTSSTEDPASADSPSQVVTFRLCKTSQALWSVFLIWAGGEQGIVGSRKILDKIARNTPRREYLQYQLPDGPLLEEIRAAVAPPYNTKSIMPVHADSTRAKRRPSTRKVGTTNTQTPAVDKQPPAKRKQPQKAKAAVPSAPIACRSCGQTDVPLMMGGRYCRACIDAGKATEEIPRLPYSHYTHTFKAFEAGSSGGTASPQTPSAQSMPPVGTNTTPASLQDNQPRTK